MPTAVAVRTTCRHCRKRTANKGRRGMCWTCHQNPTVRESYQFEECIYTRRGVGNENHERPLPASPTTHLPGTPEKEAVLIARAENGEALWHPRDAKHD